MSEGPYPDMKKMRLFCGFASLSGPNTLPVKLETVDLVRGSILTPAFSTCKEIQTALVCSFLNQLATEVV